MLNESLANLTNGSGGNVFDLGSISGTSGTISLGFDVSVTMNAAGASFNEALLFGNATQNSAIRVGDLNGDGHIDVSDIAVMMQALSDPDAYYASYAPPFGLLSGDVNGDGKFNNLDIQALISLVANNTSSGGGSGSGAVTAVPEPTSQVLAGCGLAALALTIRRRRATFLRYH